MTTPIKKGRWQATPKTTDTRDSTPFALQLKALLISISTHDAALIALAVIFAAVPLLAAWRALP